MHKLILPLLAALAFAAAGCDRKPTDPPKPKTSVMESASPASMMA